MKIEGRVATNSSTISCLIRMNAPMTKVLKAEASIVLTTVLFATLTRTRTTARRRVMIITNGPGIGLITAHIAIIEQS